jgi:hypothetical protein
MKIDKKISSRFTIDQNFARNRESWKPLLRTTTYNKENNKKNHHSAIKQHHEVGFRDT